MSQFATLPQPPYYTVIFSSQRTDDESGYNAAADRMVELASQQEGFLGVETTRDDSGFGITVSYWASESAIVAWKAQIEHARVQALGKSKWYEHYELRVAKVERAYAKL